MKITDPELVKFMLNPLRLELLEQIAILGGKARVSDLAKAVSKPPNQVSYHLASLAERGFIARTNPPHGGDARETWYEMKEAVSFDLGNADSALTAVVDQLMQQTSRWADKYREAILRVDKKVVEDRVRMMNSFYVLTPEEEEAFHRDLTALFDRIHAQSKAHADAGESISHDLDGPAGVPRPIFIALDVLPILDDDA